MLNFVLSCSSGFGIGSKPLFKVIKMLKSKNSIYNLLADCSGFGPQATHGFNLLNRGYVPANFGKGSPLSKKLNNIYPRGKTSGRIKALKGAK
jgi:hypothetical protein